jgi:hypothetical protein
MRIRGIHTVVLLTALAVSGCGQEDSHKAASQASSASIAPAPGQARMAADGQQQRRIAVSHTFTLRMPSAEMDQVQKRHMDACLKSDCTILSSQFSRNDNGNSNASLSVRVAPDAYDAFIASLSAAPARVVGHSETAEDKTVAILDVEARIKSKKILRDQLEALLKQQGKAPLADLLAVEKELSNVQGEIESATAQYTYLTTLTDSIRIDINYYSDFVPTDVSDFAPIANALHRVKTTFALSVASLITFVAGVLPWIPVMLLALWGVRLLWRRWRRKS